MATYYIDPNGDDVNGDGSSGNPWATPQHANDNSSNGDTIIFKDGTYTWANNDFDMNYVRTYKAENTGDAILDASDGEINIDVENSTGQIAIEGIHFKNARGNDASQYAVFSMGSGGSKDVLVTNCTFQDIQLCGNSYNHGGLFGYRYGNLGGSLEFIGCKFIDIIISPNSGGNGQTGIAVCDDDHDYHIKMYNCTAYFSVISTVAMSIFGSGRVNPNVHTTLSVKNNIFYNESGQTVHMNKTYSPTVENYDYNCSYGVSNTLSGTGNITSDPLFIDKDNGDFRLRQSSPCVDTGTII